jgi:hypothetical protein
VREATNNGNHESLLTIPRGLHNLIMMWLCCHDHRPMFVIHRRLGCIVDVAARDCSWNPQLVCLFLSWNRKGHLCTHINDVLCTYYVHSLHKTVNTLMRSCPWSTNDSQKIARAGVKSTR